jgi:hypothetical protein
MFWTQQQSSSLASTAAWFSQLSEQACVTITLVGSSEGSVPSPWRTSSNWLVPVGAANGTVQELALSIHLSFYGSL